MKNKNDNIGTNKGKRYRVIKNHRGIRKDLFNGKYEAYKTINGTRHSAYFDSLVAAMKWRNEFHPTLTNANSEMIGNINTMNPNMNSSINPMTNAMVNRNLLNGIDPGITFQEVWSLYQKFRFPSLSTARKNKLLTRFQFMDRLLDERMANFNPTFFDLYIEGKKRACLKNLNLRRYNYDFELEIVKNIFNWYRENYDHTFYNPILKRHYVLGIIRRLKKVNKKMPPESLVLFFSTLPQFWRDVAQFQFFTATRIGEVAGLQISSIDFKRKTVTIENNAVFNHTGDKHIIELKPPKNGESRILNITGQLEEILRRRLMENVKGCTYLFNINGSPLSYRQCQNNYNRVLKKTGLYQKGYRSTHFLRHSAATITREICGGLDYVAAMTGHKDMKMLQHYASLSADKFQMEASEKLEGFMRGLTNGSAGSAGSGQETDIVRRPLSLVENS
ncbi:MAG: site-specific integrase [Oligoflexia bacterium]|nr:site-specific integrase [Oligoflexia bacterium]